MSEKNWDAIWEECKFISDYSLRFHGFLDNFARYNSPASVMEAGCGSGDALKIFDKHKKNCFGVDISDVSLQRTRGNSNIKVIKGNILHLPFQDSVFDLVYNSGVIEHFPYPANIEAIKEMTRVTKLGGNVIIIIPNKLCSWYIMAKYLLQMINKWPFGYEESYTPRQLKSYIMDAGGLEITEYIGMQVFPPLATHNSEFAGIKLRDKVAQLEKLFPYKYYYAYALGVVCKKVH